MIRASSCLDCISMLVGDQSSRIIAELVRYLVLAARTASSPRSVFIVVSKKFEGVTSAGVSKSSKLFTRRMWANLFAFARCLQFPRYKEIAAMIRGQHQVQGVACWIGGHDLWRMYASTISRTEVVDGHNGRLETISRHSTRAGKFPTSDLIDNRDAGHQLDVSLALAHQDRVQSRRASISGWA